MCLPDDQTTPVKPRLVAAMLAAAAVLILAGWWFRYEPVPSPIPGVRVVWDRIGHRFCGATMQPPPAQARATFDELWDGRAPGWTIGPLRCD